MNIGFQDEHSDTADQPNPPRGFFFLRRLVILLPIVLFLARWNPWLLAVGFAIVVLFMIGIFHELRVRPQFSLRAMLFVVLWIGLTGSLFCQTQEPMLMGLGGVSLLGLILSTGMVVGSVVMDRLFSEEHRDEIDPARIQMIQRKLSKEPKQ